MYRYKYHRDIKSVNYDRLTDANTTFLSLDYFLTFFYADSSHWQIFDTKKVLIPAYTHFDKYRRVNYKCFIKFSSRKEYSKFKKWYYYRDLFNSEDNCIEISTLAKYVKENMEIQNKKVHDELQKLLEK